MTVEHGEVLLGRGELVDGNRQHVIAEILMLVLVEVVADAGTVREEMLDRHVLGDQREIRSEHGPSGCRQLENALLDQAHDRQRGQGLRPRSRVLSRVLGSLGIS